jgi:hypothetical protein
VDKRAPSNSFLRNLEPRHSAGRVPNCMSAGGATRPARTILAGTTPDTCFRTGGTIPRARLALRSSSVVPFGPVGQIRIPAGASRLLRGRMRQGAVLPLSVQSGHCDLVLERLVDQNGDVPRKELDK